MMTIMCVKQRSKNYMFELEFGIATFVLHFRPELSRPFSLGSEVLLSDNQRLCLDVM